MSTQAKTGLRMTRTLADWLHAEPFTLAMSSGFFGFFAHAGMLLALEERSLLPRRLTGSSAGGLVAGLFGSGLPSDRIRSELLGLERQDFWDPGFGAGLLKGRLFAAQLERILPVRRFEECRYPVSVSVFDLRSRTTRVLRKGALAPALQASCTVPFLFQPLWHEGRPLLDGGLCDRPGLHDVQPNERVLYHHLAARSPWRRTTSPQLQIPTRPGLTALVLNDLPVSGPFRMKEGALALRASHVRTQVALDQPHQPTVFG